MTYDDLAWKDQPFPSRQYRDNTRARGLEMGVALDSRPAVLTTVSVAVLWSVLFYVSMAGGTLDQ